MSEEHDNIAETIADLTRATQTSTFQSSPQHVPVMVHHCSMKMVDIEEKLPNPVRIRASKRVLDPRSFLVYFQKYANPDALLKVSDRERVISACLDYHSVGVASHCTHLLAFGPEHTVHFSHWTKNSAKPMDQRSFAEFIEDHLGDIVKPEAADILDMIRTIRIIRGGSFVSEIDATSAGVKVDVATEVKAKCGRDGLEIPSHITLRTQVFRFGRSVEVKARVRVRPDDGNLKISYEIVDLEALVEREFRVMADDIIDEVGDYPVLEV